MALEGPMATTTLSYHPLSQTMGLKVIGAHYQQLHQCHSFQIDQRDCGFPDVGDDTEKTEPI